MAHALYLPFGPVTVTGATWEITDIGGATATFDIAGKLRKMDWTNPRGCP